MSKHFYHAYIGTNSIRGSQGIYSVRVDADTLNAQIISTSPIYNSGSLTLSSNGQLLYSAVEGMTFEGYADGGAVAYHIQKTGELERINGQRTFGQRTCCIAVDSAARHVYACNFYHGTWTAFDVDQNGALLPARYVVNPPEDAPLKALHCIGLIGDRYVGVVSLTECAFIVYKAENGERITSYNFDKNNENGKRPFVRYFTTYGKNIYVMMQFPDDIYVFENCLDDENCIKLIQKIPVMDENYSGIKATSTLRITPDGSLLMAANRPSDSITVFRRDDEGRLHRSSIAVLPGKVPRDFNISADGKIVVTALQASDEISFHEIDYTNAALISRGETLKIPSPAAVAVGKIEVF